jgi:hypothetical protein
MKSTSTKNKELCTHANPLPFAAKTKTFLLLIFLGMIVASSCKKQDVVQPDENVGTLPAVESRNIVPQFPGLSTQTLWELQQARASTARYRQLQNALRDGYEDIDVVTPGMGHHFMKPALLDTAFDFSKPEILVYNKHHDGSFELVAVEYAVPINLRPLMAPGGFTGSADVWDKNLGFGLWLLHAWVWAENPLGVFNPTNPLVHTH